MIALYPMKTLMNLSSGASIKYLFELLVCCCLHEFTCVFLIIVVFGPSGVYLD